jgi:flavin-dependent dehydrogenase
MSGLSAEIGVIGGGPSGAHVASRLASAGREVVILDPKGAWEKPCGGGVPSRAIREFGFLLEASDYPRKLVRRITIISPVDRRVTINLKDPFAIYSREVLNGLVLDRALEAGAELVRAAVHEFSREPDGWTLRTDDGRTLRVRFLIGADGAASSTRRRLIGIFSKDDLALAFGYNVALTDGVPPTGRNRNGGAAVEDRVPEEVTIRFLKDFTGYLWAFPRPGVMNFGVASKLGERTSSELRAILTDFIRGCCGGKLPEPERMSFFGAKIPTLDLGTWGGLKASGDRWALVGDAAGFADPITGEGIYYAFKSADLLAEALLGTANGHSTDDARLVASRIEEADPARPDAYSRATSQYESAWREAFGRDLEHASYRLPHFYHGTFLGSIFTDAMVRLARRHRGVRTILARALMGEQSYVTLKRDLIRRAWQLF